MNSILRPNFKIMFTKIRLVNSIQNKKIKKKITAKKHAYQTALKPMVLKTGMVKESEK